MNVQQSANRLIEKTTLHTIQVELQEGYNLSLAQGSHTMAALGGSVLVILLACVEG